MTLSLACEAIEAGEAQWDEPVVISQRPEQTPRSRLGLHSTHYANAHGLPDPAQRSTAEDLAKLTGRLLLDQPAARPLLGGANFVYRGRVYARRIPLFQDPGGVQALKTGFTREAGYNLAVSAWRAGERFLLIVLGAQTRSLSFRDARALLQYGFHETGIETAPEPKH